MKQQNDKTYEEPIVSYYELELQGCLASSGTTDQMDIDEIENWE